MQIANRFAKAAVALVAAATISLFAVATAGAESAHALANSPYVSIVERDATSSSATASDTGMPEQQKHVMDSARILTDSEVKSLEEKAKAIEDSHQCSVYIVTVEDFTRYGSSMREVAKAVRESMDLGYGSGKDTIMLLLSMDDRDYWLLGYGTKANRSMTDYARENYIAPRFLDDFKHNDWYAGFDDYLDASEYVLSKAEAGEPLEKSNDTTRGPLPNFSVENFPIIFGISFVLALAVCLILRAGSKTVGAGTEAHAYVVPNSSQLHVQEDRYAYTTVQRHPKPKSNGSIGGTSIDSGGYSGSGGKF